MSGTRYTNYRNTSQKVLDSVAGKHEWTDGKISVGDCLENMKAIPDATVDLIVTSPPYNAKKEYEGEQTEEQFTKFTTSWLEECARILKPGCRLFVNTGWWSLRGTKRFCIPTLTIDCAKPLGLRLFSWINWVKNSLENPNTSGSAWGDYYSPSPFFMNGDEPVLMFQKEGVKNLKRRRTAETDEEQKQWVKFARTPWEIRCGRDPVHPAVFPVELAYRCIFMCSDVGEVVVDPFGGSGTTGVAARMLNRKFILFERDEKYAKRAEKRLDEQMATGEVDKRQKTIEETLPLEPTEATQASSQSPPEDPPSA